MKCDLSWHVVAYRMVSIFQVLVTSRSPMVAYEVVVSLQRLVNKYGKDQQRATWDVILDMVTFLLSLVEVSEP